MERNKRRNPLMPVLLAIRLTGYVPFTIDQSGQLRWSVKSFCWALSFVSALAVCVVHFYFLRVDYDWDDYSASLVRLREVMLVGMLVQPVFTLWTSLPRFLDALNKWNEMHEEVVSVTGASEQHRVYARAKAGVALISLATCMVVAYSDWHQVTLSHLFARLLLLVVAFDTLIVALLWVVLTLMVKNAFDLINDDLARMTSTTVHKKNALIQIRGAPDACRLSSRRLLWLSLHSCADSLARSLDRVVGLWLLEAVLFLCSLLYGCLKSRQLDWQNVRFFGNSCIFAVMTYAVFRFSHSAQDSITNNIVSTLFSFRSTALSDLARDEVDLFISTVETSRPCFQVFAVVKLDKKEYINLVITINTYVVVLLQFDHIINH